MTRPERVTQPFLDILEAIWQSSDGAHGYELAKMTKRGRPTIYNNLDRLSSLGWIENSWEDPSKVRGRPLRKVYRLTPEGLARAEEILIEAGRIDAGGFNEAVEGLGE